MDAPVTVPAHRPSRYARDSPRSLPAADPIYQSGLEDGVEITHSLRNVDAVDPVRYDFALCHIGMMNACGFGRPSEIPNAR